MSRPPCSPISWIAHFMIARPCLEPRTVTFGPKGSYRLEHVIRFIETVMEDFTPERQQANDWRLLFLDAFAPHLDPAVVTAAWAKGYVVVYHGGGSTGVCQVNDTDCHASFETEYLNCESQSFMDRQMIDPSDINRSRQEVPSGNRWVQNEHGAHEFCTTCGFPGRLSTISLQLGLA